MNKKTTKLRKILLLDKNRAELNRLRETIASIMSCEISTADSVVDALRIINRDIPDLIITEWKLTDHSAEDLLHTLKTRDEWSAIPVLISTSSSSQAFKLRARKLGAYDFTQKPINRSHLRWHFNLLFAESQRISDTRKKEEKMKKPLVEIIRLSSEKIRQVQGLMPLPEIARVVMDVSNDPNSTPRELTEIISKDLSLTARILRTVNSAYYGFHRKIGNINRAVIILGFNEIVNITLASCLMIEYGGGESGSPYFKRELFWKHSLAVAYIAQALSKFIPSEDRKNAFVMGLLHDFGKVVMDQHFNNTFIKLLKIAHDREERLHSVSRELMNIDHADIGAIITETWKLPVNLVRAIEYHHQPKLAAANQYGVHLNHLANYFAHHRGFGVSGNPVPDEPYSGSLKTLGIESKDLNDVWRSLKINLALLN